MSKSNHKLKEKFVGATIGRPHFRGITKKENGITLIALIITIIVMLVLTGVTLAVTLGENGLIAKANEAKIQMQIETDREELLSAVVGAIGIDGKVDFTYLDSHLPAGFTGNNGTYTSENGNTFTVSEDGEVEYTDSDDVIENGDENQNEIPTEFEKYIMGQTLTGRVLYEFDEDGNQTGILQECSQGMTFEDDPLTEDVNEVETLGVEYITLIYDYDTTKYFIYSKYDNNAYKIIIDEEFKSEKIELIYKPKGSEGEKIKIGEEEWTILYDNGTTVEVVGPISTEILRLGYPEGSTNSVEDAIESYNNAITIINDFCKNIEGLPEDAIEVRSVGAASETTTDKQSLMASSSEYNEVGLKGDANFEQDFIRMFCFGVVTTGEEYWVASRLVDSDLYDDFMVRCVGAEGYLEYDVLWRITSTGHATGFNGSRRVRPVITIEKP